MEGKKPKKRAPGPRERVRGVRQLRAQGWNAQEIVESLQKTYGITAATALKDLEAASAGGVGEIRRTLVELRAESYEVYRSVIRDKESKPADRLRAQERIDRLLGIVPDDDKSGAGDGGEKEVQVVLEGLSEVELEVLERLGEKRVARAESGAGGSET